jgi:hypothetical protein
MLIPPKQSMDGHLLQYCEGLSNFRGQIDPELNPGPNRRTTAPKLFDLLRNLERLHGNRIRSAARGQHGEHRWSLALRSHDRDIA